MYVSRCISFQGDSDPRTEVRLLTCEYREVLWRTHADFPSNVEFFVVKLTKNMN
jgi:hypothetical protein